MTEIGVALAVIALFVWLFLRGNSRRGVRTVRAHTFLEAVRAGQSVEEANQAAAALDAKALPRRAIHDTMLYLNEHHRGRQAPLIKAAEKAGWKE